MGATLTLPQACTVCGQSTQYCCDACKKPHCGHGACLFETGEWLTLPSDPRNEDYAESPTWDREEELCLACYTLKMGKSPLVLWQGGSAETKLVAPGIIKGSRAYAGDKHSWVSDPQAGKMLLLRWGEQHIELDTFRTLQLLEWL